MTTVRGSLASLVLLALAGCTGSSGSRLALTAELVPTSATDARALAAAATVLEDRIGAAVRFRVHVSVHGDRLQVFAGNVSRDVLQPLLGAGHLGFRRVLEAEPVQAGHATPTAARSGDAYSAAAFEQLDCTRLESRAPATPDLPTREVVACDAAGTYRFHLGPAQVGSSDVQSAKPEEDTTTGTQQVLVHFTNSGQERFTAVTKELYAGPAPSNQLAILLDGVVLTAPYIASVITGDAQITGDFTKDSATRLAAVLNYGALPVAFRFAS